ncbi:MAG: acyloxyacyl hydrolase [Salinibacter sp.]|uniref:acyloxyacyl hydrolase n=1 Tax=Salinibacter sp. TaxID=2065818 RepID=UPI002FC3B753
MSLRLPPLYASPQTNLLCILHVRLVIVTVLISLGLVGPCGAQSADSLASGAASPSTNAVSAWAGGSFATVSLIGNIQNAHVGLLGLRYHRLLTPSSPNSPPRGPTLTYMADLVPVLLVSIPSGALPTLPLDASGTEGSSPGHRSQTLTAYGVGVRPAGLRLTYRPAERVQPFVAGSTGLALFDQSIPNTLGRSLNFMFDVGAGVRIAVTPALVLTASYRYYHLSNGFRGQINPGVDANLLQLGVTVSP